MFNDFHPCFKKLFKIYFDFEQKEVYYIFEPEKVVLENLL